MEAELYLKAKLEERRTKCDAACSNAGFCVAPEEPMMCGKYQVPL